MFDFVTIPFGWLMKQLYLFTGSYGVAIILFALVTKIVLFYFSAKGKRGMMQQQRLQPKLQALQKQYKDDKVKFQQAQQKLYQDEGVSMMGGCLWSLLPLVVLLPLYNVIRMPLTYIIGIAADKMTALDAAVRPLLEAAGKILPAANDTYYQLKLSNMIQDVPEALAAAQTQVPDFFNVSYNFLGLNLGETPTLAFNWLILLPIIAAGSQVLAMWFSTRLNRQIGVPQQGGKFMLLIGPVISLWFSFIMPALLGLYWIAQSLFGMAQDYFLTKHFKKIFDAEDARKAELEARRKAAEEAMKEEQRQRRAEAIEAKKQKRKPGQTIYKVKGAPKPKPRQSESEED
jgi:YidC/Oxa1 family membrane protein insertase